MLKFILDSNLVVNRNIKDVKFKVSQEVPRVYWYYSVHRHQRELVESSGESVLSVKAGRVAGD